jgi:hypothetical protein
MKKQLVGLILTAMMFFWLGQKFIHPPVAIGNLNPAFSVDPNSKVSAKVAVLNQVLADQTDNDSRVDHELSKLNQKDRLDFRDKYRSLRAESLRDRGLIVYLLGRNIETQGDLDFMKEVLNERNCLSLENCAVTDQKTLSAPEMASHLAFPKLMAIAALKAKLEARPSNKMREAIESILQGARASMNPLIVKAAS